MPASLLSRSRSRISASLGISARARPVSASADTGRAKIPEGGRFAAAAFPLASTATFFEKAQQP